MALDNVTSHFSTMLETIASASFLSSFSIIDKKQQEGLSSYRLTSEVDVRGGSWLFLKILEVPILRSS